MLLTIEKLQASYGQSQILHDIDLEIGSEARVCVLGRNGAGKTTLLKSVTNAGPRTLGAIVFDGASLSDMPWYKRAALGITLVPEDRRIFGHLTVEENIELARFANRKRRPIPTAEILERFPLLQPLSRRFGGQLSGGQQQVLAVARAIATRPRLLLLDEPTEGLAPVIVGDLARTISSICRELGIALLLVEQSIWFARQCTEWVYVLDTGSVVFGGNWQSFDANDGVRNRHLAVA